MRFVKESFIDASPERVFAFHEQADALKLLIPPWEHVRVIKSARISEVGSEAIVETTVVGPFTVRWVAKHTAYDPPRSFEDIQFKGPFRHWRHRHLVELKNGGTLLRDEIDYEPPLGFLGRLFAPLLVERRLKRLFNYRHDVTRKWATGDKTGQG